MGEFGPLKTRVCIQNVFSYNAVWIFLQTEIAWLLWRSHFTKQTKKLNKDSQIKMGDGSVTVWTMDMLFDFKRQEYKIYCNYPAFFTHLRLDCRALTSLRKLVAQWEEITQKTVRGCRSPPLCQWQTFKQKKMEMKIFPQMLNLF